MSATTTDDIPARTAVLEEIARSTKAALDRIERRLDTMDTRIDQFSAESHADFRWLIGIMVGGFGMTIAGFGGILAVMAHGFHWL